MALPRKKSRTITVEGATYRWLVSMHRGVLHLTVESDDDPGQLLQSFFEPHDQFKRKSDGNWLFHRQGRSITPGVVTRIIQHGLANGWQPLTKGHSPIRIHTWDADDIAQELIDGTDDEVAAKDLAIEQVSDLRYDLSLDPHWRKTLFDAPVAKRFPIPEDYFAISDRVRECGLRFAAFNDGWTDFGFVVFGIESVDFPRVAMYTTNNPAMVNW